MNKPLDRISSSAMKMLVEYDWPGNVRELENAIERAVVVCRAKEITPPDFPFFNIPSGEDGPKEEDSVITSYSIHYTKLYDYIIKWNLKEKMLPKRSARPAKP